MRFTGNPFGCAEFRRETYDNERSEENDSEGNDSEEATFFTALKQLARFLPHRLVFFVL
jgi:hypothetical protein